MDERANIAIARAMCRAYEAGDVEQMLTLLHDRVMWLPLSRPGRSLYRGHEGIRAMLADITAANPSFGIEFGDVAEPEPGLVTVASTVSRVDDGVRQHLPIVLRCTIRDGLIVDVETRPAEA